MDLYREHFGKACLSYCLLTNRKPICAQINRVCSVHFLVYRRMIPFYARDWYGRGIPRWNAWDISKSNSYHQEKTPIAEPAILKITLLKKLIRLMTRSIACPGTKFMTEREWAMDLPPKCTLAQQIVDVDASKVIADYTWQHTCLLRKKCGLVIIHANLLTCLS